MDVYWHIIFSGLVYLAAGEVSLLRHGEFLYCVASESDSDSALIWTQEVRSSAASLRILDHQDSWRVPPAPEPLSKQLNCILNPLVSSSASNCPLKKIMDQRFWEIGEWSPPPRYLPTREHCVGSVPLTFLAPNTSLITSTPARASRGRLEVRVTVRAGQLAVVLGSDEALASPSKYELRIDEGGTTKLRRFHTATLSGKYHTEAPYQNCTNCQPSSSPLLLEGSEWVSLRVLVHKEGKEDVVEVRRGARLLQQWRLTPSLVDTLDFVSVQALGQPGFWWRHPYKVLQTTSPERSLDIPFTSTASGSLCLSVTYFMSWHVHVELVLQSHWTTPVRHHLPVVVGWSVFKWHVPVEENYPYFISIFPHSGSPTFVIGEIRVCSVQEYLVTKIPLGSRNKSTSCSAQRSDYTVRSREKINHERFVDSCPEGSLGGSCAVRCCEVIPGARGCGGATLCRADTCSCLPGFWGHDCRTVCEAGSYGPECRVCGHCKEGSTCDLISGHCVGCEPGWLPPLCLTRHADEQGEASSSSLWLAGGSVTPAAVAMTLLTLALLLAAFCRLRTSSTLSLWSGGARVDVMTTPPVSKQSTAGKGNVYLCSQESVYDEPRAKSAIYHEIVHL